MAYAAWQEKDGAAVAAVARAGRSARGSAPPAHGHVRARIPALRARSATRINIVYFAALYQLLARYAERRCRGIRHVNVE